jgi:hypothetical protein
MTCKAFLVKSVNNWYNWGMPSAAASAILEGMPDTADLRVLRSDGQTWIFAGTTALFQFADGDTAMRNIAVAALRQIGFPGTQVAAALGLTHNHVGVSVHATSDGACLYDGHSHPFSEVEGWHAPAGRRTCEPRPLAQDGQIGTAPPVGARKTWDPADESLAGQPERASADSEVRPGPRPPTLRPHHRETV